MMENEESRKEKRKKRNLVIVLVVLVILFFCYGVSLSSTPENREEKIISYLEKKYNSEFKIIEMTSSGEHIILNELNCDGTTFCPEIKDKGVYYYRYNVQSLSDNIIFEVEYLDKRLKDTITEITSYSSLMNKDKSLADINDYIVNLFGNVNSKILQNSVSVEFDEKFVEICDSNYRKKLEQLSTFVRKKKHMYEDQYLSVYFEYSDDTSVSFGSKEPIIILRSDESFEGTDGVDSVTGKYIKIYYSLDEYFNR